ncbi:MAG: TetR/AcrR family transcriptional regulator [Bacteroidota bacterium]
MSKFNPATQEKILQAAEKVFHENGLKGARTTLIAERAGVSRTMLHYYFRSKEDLFQEVLQISFGFFLGKAQKLFTSGSDLKGLIDNFIDLLYEILSEKPGLPSFMVNILNESPELITNLAFIQDENIPDLIEQLLKEARDKKEIQSDISGEDLILNIYGMVAMPFLTAPLIRFKEDRSPEAMQAFIHQRKEMIKSFVWNAIKLK